MTKGWLSINDLGLGQVNLMACGLYMLCQSRCSHTPILECSSVYTEAVLQGSARLSNAHLRALGTGVWYTTPLRWSMG